MENKRILYMDALRVFSIFCVVILHVCAIDWYAVGVDSMHWQILNFYDGLVRFCVPVFVMISGAFFLNPDKEYTIKDIFFKKILRVAVTFLFWSLVYLVVCKDVEIAGTSDFIYKWLTGSRYHLWFPFTIIGLYIISPVLKEVCKNKKACEYFIVLWFICQAVGMTVNQIPGVPQTVLTLKSYLVPQAALGYAGYFVLGYYLSRYEFSKKIRLLSYAGGLLGAFVTVAGTAYVSIRLKVGIGALYDYLMPNTVLVSAGLFLFFKYNIKAESFGKLGAGLIKLLARLTFGIYLVHEMFIYLLKHELGITTALFNPIFSVPLFSAGIFLLSAAVVFVIDKIPVLKKYIM